MIRMVIPGEPVPQGRGRAVRMGSKVKVIDPAPAQFPAPEAIDRELGREASDGDERGAA